MATREAQKTLGKQRGTVSNRLNPLLMNAAIRVQAPGNCYSFVPLSGVGGRHLFTFACTCTDWSLSVDSRGPFQRWPRTTLPTSSNGPRLGTSSWRRTRMPFPWCFYTSSFFAWNELTNQAAYTAVPSSKTSPTSAFADKAKMGLPAASNQCGRLLRGLGGWPGARGRGCLSGLFPGPGKD